MRTPLERLDGDALRDLERESIREFVETCAPLLGGRVLDYGAGKMPYRHIVDAAGGVYEPFDRIGFPASVATENLNPAETIGALSVDAILSTQVLQYAEDPNEMLALFFRLLRRGGRVILTGKTTWPEIEQEDFWGFTTHGIRAALERQGFAVERCEKRGEFDLGGFRLALGFGVVARRPQSLIYALLDPESGEPRYVGQTTQPPARRLGNHVNESVRERTRPVSLWIRSLDGDVPRVRVLEADPEDANESERRWFHTLLREGHDLLNASVGNTGRRTPLRKHRPPMSEEQRAKVSEFFAGRPKSPTSNALRSISASAKKKEPPTT